MAQPALLLEVLLTSVIENELFSLRYKFIEQMTQPNLLLFQTGTDVGNYLL